MRSTTEIKEAITAVKATVTKWQQDKQKSADALEEANAVWMRNAFAARSGDASAKKVVDKAAIDAAKHEKEVKDIEYSIAGADKKIAELETEHEASHRGELSLQFDSLAKKAADEGVFLAGAISGLANDISNHNETLRKLRKLADELGLNSAPLKIAHLHRFLEAELHKLSPSEFGRPAGDWQHYRNSRYDTFLEGILNKRLEQTEELKTGTE